MSADVRQAMLIAEMDRLYAYWTHIDDRLHSTLQLLAGVGSLLTAAAGVKVFADSDSRRWLALGSLLVVLGLLAAVGAVIQAGNQAGKLLTVLALERLRTELVGDNNQMIGLPTFGRMHVRVDRPDEVDAVLTGRRNDYRPITVTVLGAASMLVVVGATLLLGVAGASLWLAILAALALGAVVGASAMAVATKATRVLARRMARGFAHEWDKCRESGASAQFRTRRVSLANSH